MVTVLKIHFCITVYFLEMLKKKIYVLLDEHERAKFSNSEKLGRIWAAESPKILK